MGGRRMCGGATEVKCPRPLPQSRQSGYFGKPSRSCLFGSAAGWRSQSVFSTSFPQHRDHLRQLAPTELDLRSQQLRRHTLHVC